MIIWNGLGFLVAVFVFVAALITNLVFDQIYGPEYYPTHKWTIGVAMFVAAAASYIVGSMLKKRTAQIVIDKATGKEIKINRSSHQLFFIPMHYWGLILSIIGIVLFVLEFVK